MAENYRQHYPLITAHSELAYWDSAATTPAPRPVIETMKHWAETRHANVHRGQYDLEVKSTAALERTREQARVFLDAPADWTIVFNSGTTAGLNQLAAGYPLQADDIVVVTADAHHSLLVPWQQAIARVKAKLVVVPVDHTGALDMTVWGEVVARRPRVVALTHVSNVSGCIHDIGQLASQAKAVGATVMVDGAQAVPHLQVILKDWPVDAYAFSAHKMSGPTGVGILALSPDLTKQLAPTTFGGGMVEDVAFEKTTWADAPARFEAGTPNLWGIAGLSAALTWAEAHREAIAGHDQQITSLALRRLRQIPGLTLFGPLTEEDRIPLFSFSIEGLHPHDVAEVMGERGVAVRAGHHCAMPLHQGWKQSATVRASAGLYTTEEDVAKLEQAIGEAIKVLYRGR